MKMKNDNVGKKNSKTWRTRRRKECGGREEEEKPAVFSWTLPI
jgi:hypothetical protein